MLHIPLNLSVHVKSDLKFAYKKNSQISHLWVSSPVKMASKALEEREKENECKQHEAPISQCIRDCDRRSTSPPTITSPSRLPLTQIYRHRWRTTDGSGGSRRAHIIITEPRHLCHNSNITSSQSNRTAHAPGVLDIPHVCPTFNPYRSRIPAPHSGTEGMSKDIQSHCMNVAWTATTFRHSIPSVAKTNIM